MVVVALGHPLCGVSSLSAPAGEEVSETPQGQGALARQLPPTMAWRPWGW